MDILICDDAKPIGTSTMAGQAIVLEPAKPMSTIDDQERLITNRKGRNTNVVQ
ncbi:hypothetical protein J6590_101415, partial [Homalodisca vitripennis]